jgi:hypothetical protein
MHRFIMGAKSGIQVDHENNNSLDNRRKNLRFATNAQNARNRGKQKNNASGYKGVYWEPGRNKWMVQISTGKRRITIGRFDDVIEAAREYDKAAKRYHGEFANTNF